MTKKMEQCLKIVIFPYINSLTLRISNKIMIYFLYCILNISFAKFHYNLTKQRYLNIPLKNRAVSHKNSFNIGLCGPLRSLSGQERQLRWLSHTLGLKTGSCGIQLGVQHSRKTQEQVDPMLFVCLM